MGWLFSAENLQYLWNGVRQDQGCYWSLIGNCICTFDWYRNQWSWMILMAMCTLVQNVYVFQFPVWKLDEDRPILSVMKMAATVFFGNIRFMWIFAGVFRRGHQTTVRLSKVATFSCVGNYIFGTFRDKAKIIIWHYIVFQPSLAFHWPKTDDLKWSEWPFYICDYLTLSVVITFVILQMNSIVFLLYHIPCSLVLSN